MGPRDVGFEYHDEQTVPPSLHATAPAAARG
jgi:hypothetical protein